MTQEEAYKKAVKAITRSIKMQVFLWGWCWCVVAELGLRMLTADESWYWWLFCVPLFAANATVAIYNNPFRKGGIFEFAAAFIGTSHGKEKG
jgi:hypothetical protein